MENYLRSKMTKVMTKDGLYTQTQESPVKLHPTCKKMLIEEVFTLWLTVFPHIVSALE